MNLIPCESSNLSGYAFVSGEGIFIRFKSGALYRYPEATEVDFTALHMAESKGKFFHKVIRPQVCEQIEEPEPAHD